MKESYQSYVFMGLLASLLVVSFTGCEKSEGIADSRQSIADSNANSNLNTSASQSSMDAAQKAMDLQLAKKVEKALTDEEALGEFDIAVFAANGVVQLTGEVETRAEHDLAVKVTRNVDGVDRISDQLRVKQ